VNFGGDVVKSGGGSCGTASKSYDGVGAGGVVVSPSMNVRDAEKPL
jgi:hypothetical protein